MEGINPNRYLLLTGAGFTANWGGKLAFELWDEFYAHPEIRRHQRVKDRFKHESSFETALASGYSQGFTEEESASIEKAVFDCFKRMDDTLSDVGHRNQTNIDCHKLTSQLFGRMCAAHRERTKQTYLFTVNQDILLERIWFRENLHGRHPPELPGVPPCRLTRCGNRSSNIGYFGPNLPSFSAVYMEVTDPLVSPITDDFERKVFGTNYVKLHGSFNWRKATGRSELVIGTEKTRQIHDSPLLDWYGQIFRSVLSHQDLKMMVIGYSFQDEHLNTHIFDAVLNRGLELYVWDIGFDRIRRGLVDDAATRLPGLRSVEDGERILDAVQSRCLQMNRVVPYQGSQVDFNRIVEEFFT